MNKGLFQPLKDLTSKIGSGATPSGGQANYKNEGISLIRSQNVLDMSFSKDGLAFIDKEQAKKLNNVEVFANDILLNITGDSIARVCKVPEEILPARVNQHVSILRCNDLLDPNFLLYYLIYRKNYLLTISRVGGTRNALTKEAIEKLEIRIDENQQKIAAVLSTLDDKIEVNNKINAELEAMAKTLYDYWFVQFEFPITNESHPELVSGSHPVGYKSAGGKMVYNSTLKREIPEGWEVEKFGEIFNISRGTLITKETSSIGNYKVVAAGLNYSYLTGEFNREKYTITVSGSGANAGYVNFWTERIFASDCTTVRGNSDSETFLGLQFLKLYQNYIFSLAKGSAQPHVYPSDIEGLYYVCPPDNLIETFGKSSFNIYEKITNNQKQNQELAQLRDWLLPMLMNGQVTVE